MPKTLSIGLLLLLVNAGSAAADARVNAVIGDVSWRLTTGRAPRPQDDSQRRIRVHLRHVHATLRAANPPGDAATVERRAMLLEALGRYTEAGVFPRNRDRPGRAPRFFDDDGRACAVGHLMIVSGHANLARRIQAAHQYDLLETIAEGRLGPDVRAWATAHGFTLRELAMIQPQYGFEQGPFEPLTREVLAHQVRQHEFELKLCLRAQIGTAAPSQLVFRLTVMQNPTPADDPRSSLVRTLDIEATPPLTDETERCMRERIEYFYRNIAYGYRVPAGPVHADVVYRHLNRVDPVMAARVRAVRPETAARLIQARSRIERCIRTQGSDASEPARFRFVLLGDGRLLIDGVDNGPPPDCVSHATGISHRLIPDRIAEPFEVVLRLAPRDPNEPDPMPEDREMDLDGF